MIKYIAMAIHENGKTEQSRLFSSEKALSNWANKQWVKDHRVTVECDTFDTETLELKPFRTYHE